MAFQTIHTNAGLIAMAEAEAAGTAINLTEMAVGDGNGNPVTPDREQTQLARERYRASVNRVWQAPENAQRFTAELVIPANHGGWTLREIGIFDADGTLFAVGNLPEAYKPTAAEGAFSDAVVRIEFMVSNADVITLQVDPNVAVATQAWIINNITAGTLIPGGTTGQRLAKASNADGDVVWEDPNVQNITVDIIDELQTLADGQTQIDLAVTTTYGLAVYVEGLRLNRGGDADQWQPDGSLETRLHLGQSYVAGTEIYCVQNEPSGSAPAPLERSKNLADVESKSQSRANLGVYSKAESDSRSMQPGDIYYTAASTPGPRGFKANGAAVSRTAYPELYARIGTTYGAGDGFNTFNLPDLRAEFIRGWDDGRGVDAGRTLGSGQADELKSHGHSGKARQNGRHRHRNGPFSGNSGGLRSEPFEGQYGGGDYSGYSGEHSHDLDINNTGGNETRPRNVAMLACIRF